MADRDDIEIKSDIIAELDEIPFGSDETSILDALIVESVSVVDAEVVIDLVFPDRYPKEGRWELEDKIHDAIEDIESIGEVTVNSANRSVHFERAGMRWDAKNLPREEAPVAPVVAAPPTPAPVSDTPDDGGISIYAGGGCSSGTVAATPATVSVPPPAAVPPTSSPTSVAPTVLPSVGDTNPDAVRIAQVLDRAVLSGQHVAFTLADFTALVRSIRSLELRPTHAEYHEVEAQREKLQHKLEMVRRVLETQ